jgi:hypothetical protein|tara:strand:+ start:176 stop:424 length:249 start_codon:yes stop_codon:yes gene_type:complete
MWQDIENIFDFNLTDAEITELLQYSADESTLKQRYIVACQIITDFGTVKEHFSDHDQAVDLTICKMLLDGDVQVEDLNPVLH